MEFDTANGALKKEYIYGSGGLLATIEPVNGTRYTTADHLGTPRVITSSTGAVVSRHDYKAFGRELAAGVGGRTTAQGYVVDNLRQKFTGYERDNETGLDYAINRYYSSTQGRFTSADPYHIILEKEKGEDEKERRQILLNYISQPQIWNRYAYTLNNPLKYVDPDGRRELNASDLRRIERLNQEYDNAIKNNDQELADAIGQAINDIVSTIDAVPEGQQDPASLGAVFYAIDRLGDTRYASDGTGSPLSFTSNGWTASAKKNDNKCNFFVGVSYALGGGIGLSKNNGNTVGVPVTGRYLGLGGLWGSANLPTANAWNFQRVTTPQVGDVAAWGARVGSGHAGIYIGGGATIYASDRTVKVQTVTYVSEQQQRSVSYQRHKP
jgi:RHS repeat-associated protein